MVILITYLKCKHKKQNLHLFNLDSKKKKKKPGALGYKIAMCGTHIHTRIHDVDY